MRTFLRRVIKFLLSALAVVLVLGTCSAGYVDLSLDRVPAFTDYDGRGTDAGGINWLLVGSDSREGLSKEEERELVTGTTDQAEGARTDTVMLLHIPATTGPPTLISLPRDSLANIHGYGPNKLNAAYSFGGPTLLSRTVEEMTGLRVDHYLEIGLGGFAGVVDAVGGVRMCLPEPVEDPKIALKLPAGCQDLAGAQALGYVRTRHFDRGDLERAEHQREFLTALVTKATSRSILLNPLHSVPMTWRMADTVTVSDGDHLGDFGRLGVQAALTGTNLVTVTVPTNGGMDIPGVGDVVLWDKEKTDALFSQLRSGAPPDGG